MWCELIFRTVSNRVGFFYRKKFETGRTMNSGSCLCSIPFHEGLRSRPDFLKCDLTVTYFCFSPFKCLPTGHYEDLIGDPVNRLLHSGSLASCHNFLKLCLCCTRRYRQWSLLFSSESVRLWFDSLYAKNTEAVKLQAAFLFLQQCQFGFWEKLIQRLGFEIATSLSKHP